MELREFVSQTLMQIIEGVRDAQEKAHELGGIVNPTMNDFSKNANLKYVGSRGQYGDERVIYPVEFDVTLITSKSSETKGGAGLGIAVINVGGNRGKQSSQSQDAQVKFVVPILLPYDSHGFKPRSPDSGSFEPSETSKIQGY